MTLAPHFASRHLPGSIEFYFGLPPQVFHCTGCERNFAIENQAKAGFCSPHEDKTRPPPAEQLVKTFSNQSSATVPDGQSSALAALTSGGI
jgi:hypothetical protein